MIQTPKNPFDNITSQVYAGEITEKFHRLGDYIREWIHVHHFEGLRFAIIFWKTNDPKRANYVSNAEKPEMLDAWIEQLESAKKAAHIIKPPNNL